MALAGVSARCPFTRTNPSVTSLAASVRLFTKRANQSHLSRRWRSSRIISSRRRRGRPGSASPLVAVPALKLRLQGEQLGEGGIRIRLLLATLVAAARLLAIVAPLLAAGF